MQRQTSQEKEGQMIMATIKGVAKLAGVPLP
ncbi:hypothetical protein JOD24_000938 [Kroppenstedtia sanguinis]